MSQTSLISSCVKHNKQARMGGEWHQQPGGSHPNELHKDLFLKHGNYNCLINPSSFTWLTQFFSFLFKSQNSNYWGEKNVLVNNGGQRLICFVFLVRRFDKKNTDKLDRWLWIKQESESKYLVCTWLLSAHLNTDDFASAELNSGHIMKENQNNTVLLRWNCMLHWRGCIFDLGLFAKWLLICLF